MKKDKEAAPPQEKPPKRKPMKVGNHWVIQVGGNEPIYFCGNERKAEGRRIYYGVKYNGVSWKRLATDEEARQHTALGRITPEQIYWSAPMEPTNLIKKFFGDASNDEIQRARIKAQKVIDKNTKLSNIHYAKIKKWDEEEQVKLHQRAPKKR